MSVPVPIASAVVRVWKYRLPEPGSFTLDMPAGSLPLSVGVQAGQAVLWAAVDSVTGRREQHRFFLCGTGEPLDFGAVCRFVGTVHWEGLGLVYHLFDGGVEEEQT